MNKTLKIKNILILVLTLLLTLTFGCGQKELTTEYTDELKLTDTYEGKTFLKDGIGKVTLTQKVDGDTAHFRDTDGTTFTARFLLINTPESTGKIDPWGTAASKFTSGILQNAKEIVCESKVNGKPAELDTTGKRYLAFVWYRYSSQEDFRLLNLELVEQCYTDFTDNLDAGKYAEIFAKAAEKGIKLGRRVFGEKDPDFDYSYKITDATIAYLRENIAQFTEETQGSKFRLKVRIVRINGDNLYLEDYEKTSSDKTGEYTTAGIYLFSGYGKNFSSYPIGTVFEFTCKCVKNDVYGIQLTDPGEAKIIEVPEEDMEIELREFDGKSEIDLKSLEGSVIKISRVKILGVGSKNENSAYTISAITDFGQKINIRIDGNTYPKYDRYSVETGEYYSIIGGISQYSDNYQIMLTNQRGIAKNDFVLLK